MNIFVVDQDPVAAARSLCDCHVVKMCVESCQLLCTADQVVFGLPMESRYRPTHVGHPCLKCLNRAENYVWLVHHLNGLLDEYAARYGREHACMKLFRTYWERHLSTTPDFHSTNFPKCMPDEFKVNGIVESYRAYYRWKAASLPRFNYRIPDRSPSWL